MQHGDTHQSKSVVLFRKSQILSFLEIFPAKSIRPVVAICQKARPLALPSLRIALAQSLMACFPALQKGLAQTVRSSLPGRYMPEIVLIAVPPVLSSEPVEIDSVVHFLPAENLLVWLDALEDFPDNGLILRKDILILLFTSLAFTDTNIETVSFL